MHEEYEQNKREQVQSKGFITVKENKKMSCNLVVLGLISEHNDILSLPNIGFFTPMGVMEDNNSLWANLSHLSSLN